MPEIIFWVLNFIRESSRQWRLYTQISDYGKLSKMEQHTLSTNIIRLNVHGLNLAILGNNSISLASVRAEHRGSGELEVPGAGELSGGVT